MKLFRIILDIRVSVLGASFSLECFAQTAVRNRLSFPFYDACFWVPLPHCHHKKCESIVTFMCGMKTSSDFFWVIILYFYFVCALSVLPSLNIGKRWNFEVPWNVWLLCSDTNENQGENLCGLHSKVRSCQLRNKPQLLTKSRKGRQPLVAFYGAECENMCFVHIPYCSISKCASTRISRFLFLFFFFFFCASISQVRTQYLSISILPRASQCPSLWAIVWNGLMTCPNFLVVWWYAWSLSVDEVIFVVIIMSSY